MKQIKRSIAVLLSLCLLLGGLGVNLTVSAAGEVNVGFNNMDTHARQDMEPSGDTSVKDMSTVTHRMEGAGAVKFGYKANRTDIAWYSRVPAELNSVGVNIAGATHIMFDLYVSDVTKWNLSQTCNLNLRSLKSAQTTGAWDTSCGQVKSTDLYTAFSNLKNGWNQVVLPIDTSVATETVLWGLQLRFSQGSAQAGFYLIMDDIRFVNQAYLNGSDYADHVAAKQVSTMLDSISDSSSSADRNAARAAYEALTTVQQSYVVNTENMPDLVPQPLSVVFNVMDKADRQDMEPPQDLNVKDMTTATDDYLQGSGAVKFGYKADKTNNIIWYLRVPQESNTTGVDIAGATHLIFDLYVSDVSQWTINDNCFLHLRSLASSVSTGTWDSSCGLVNPRDMATAFRKLRNGWNHVVLPLNTTDATETVLWGIRMGFPTGAVKAGFYIQMDDIRFVNQTYLNSAEYATYTSDKMVTRAGALLAAAPKYTGAQERRLMVQANVTYHALTAEQQSRVANKSNLYTAGYTAKVESHFAARKTVNQGDYAFSLAVMGDLHYAVRNKASWQNVYRNSMQWILNNRQKENILMAIQVGDLTSNVDYNDGKNETSEWDAVRSGFDMLRAADMPFATVVGNHDRVYSYTNYNTYFPYEEQKNDNPYFGGAMQSGHTENMYYTFQVKGIKYMVLTLDVFPNDEEMAWANSVIRSHSDHNVILVTHSYLNSDSAGDQLIYTVEVEDANYTGEKLWNNVVKVNPNVIITMSGHNEIPRSKAGLGMMQGTNDAGKPVYQFLLGDPQPYDLVYGGLGSVVMMRFSEDGTKVAFEYIATRYDQQFVATWSDAPHHTTNYYEVDVQPVVGVESFTEWTDSIKQVVHAGLSTADNTDPNWGNYHYIAQKFLPADSTLYGVRIPFNMTSATATVRLEIRSSINGAAIASNEIDITSKGPGIKWYELKLKEPLSVTPGTPYYFVYYLTARAQEGYCIVYGTDLGSGKATYPAGVWRMANGGSPTFTETTHLQTGFRLIDGTNVEKTVYDPPLPAEHFAERSNTDPGAFSLAVLSDLHYAVNYNGAQQDIYLNSIQWILDNAEKENTLMTLQLGDITSNNKTSEWDVVRPGLDMLAQENMPFTVAVGNHDRVGGYDNFNNYVSYDEQVAKNPYLSGAMEEGESRNLYYTFQVDDVKYMVLNLEVYPNDTVLAWADSVIKAHPYHNVIVMTHAYLATENGQVKRTDYEPEASYYVGDNVWNAIIKNNPNVIATLSAHNGYPSSHENGVGLLTDINDAGKPVYQFLVPDPQGYEGIYGGLGSVFLMRFSKDGKTLSCEYVSTRYNMDFVGYANGGDYNYVVNLDPVMEPPVFDRWEESLTPCFHLGLSTADNTDPNWNNYYYVASQFLPKDDRLCGARVRLAMTSPTATVHFEVRSQLNGQAIVSKDVAINSTGSGADWYELLLDEPIAVTPHTPYYFVYYLTQRASTGVCVVYGTNHAEEVKYPASVWRMANGGEVTFAKGGKLNVGFQVVDGSYLDQVAVDEATGLIEGLPSQIALEDKAQVEAARQAVEALTPEQKALMNQETLDKLAVAESALAELEQQEADKAAAQAVVDAIHALPDSVTQEDASAVEQARVAYNGLTEIQKSLVPQETLDKLIAAEEALNIDPNQVAADQVIQLIDALPQEITLEDKARVEAAREAYDALTEVQKALVTNLQKLTDAEAALAALEQPPVDPPVEPPVEPDLLYGDADGNGTVDAADALKALQHAVKLIALEGDSYTVADVDGNQNVDAADALLMLQYTVKLIDSFPVEKA